MATGQNSQPMPIQWVDAHFTVLEGLTSPWREYMALHQLHTFPNRICDAIVSGYIEDNKSKCTAENVFKFRGALCSL